MCVYESVCISTCFLVSCEMPATVDSTPPPPPAGRTPRYVFLRMYICICVYKYVCICMCVYESVCISTCFLVSCEMPATVDSTPPPPPGRTLHLLLSHIYMYMCVHVCVYERIRPPASWCPARCQPRSTAHHRRRRRAARPATCFPVCIYVYVCINMCVYVCL